MVAGGPESRIESGDVGENEDVFLQSEPSPAFTSLTLPYRNATPLLQSVNSEPEPEPELILVGYLSLKFPENTTSRISELTIYSPNSRTSKITRHQYSAPTRVQY